MDSATLSENTLGTLDFSVVRGLRKRRGLTLRDVSNRSGLSVAVLSRMERNQTVCELETLYRLARVFGLSAADLLGLCESSSAHRKKSERYRRGFFDFDRITYRGVELFHTRARKGDSLSKPEAHGDDFEICWVREGMIRIRLPQEMHTLGPGDALHFDAVLAHTYEIVEDADLFIVHLTKTHRF